LKFVDVRFIGDAVTIVTVIDIRFIPKLIMPWAIIE